MAQLVKHPPAMRKIWIRSLAWEDPLEKGKATHSSMGSQWNMTDLATFTFLFLFLPLSFPCVSVTHLCFQREEQQTPQQSLYFYYTHRCKRHVSSVMLPCGNLSAGALYYELTPAVVTAVGK